MTQIELVDSEERLAEVAGRLAREPQVAVDVESNGFFRYRERVCLVQLAAGDKAWVVDPLAIVDLWSLGELLANASVEKVFHAAGNDIRSLHRDWDFTVRNLFDTSVAAAFAGSTQLGMQNVLKEHAGVELAKRRDLQRSDWSLRPLSDDALDYAVSDVLYLGRVQESLTEQLEKLSRLDWVAEECERLEEVRYTASDPEMAFLSTKGSHHLGGEALGVLRSLWEFRDGEACRLDRPMFKVFSDAVLVQLAEDPSLPLGEVKGLGRYAHPPGSRRLQEAITRGLAGGPVQRPERERHGAPLTSEQRKIVDARLRTLRTWRTETGEDLGLNPGLLWPAASLERLAQRPDTLEAELVSPEVRRWQQREFSGSLVSVLESLG